MQFENNYLSSLWLKFLVIPFLACAASGEAWAAELQPGEKAEIYILLDFDGDAGFPSITWQHQSNGLNAFTGASLAAPPGSLEAIKQRIIDLVEQDYAPFNNVLIVTNVEDIDFWYSWGIDDSSYVFSIDGARDNPDNDPDFVSPMSRSDSCPETRPHSCGRLYGKSGSYQNPNEQDQLGSSIFQPLFARTFAGSFSIPDGGPSQSVPQLIFGDSMLPRGPGDIEEEYIAQALANSATHEIAHMFRVVHPPQDCGDECANDIMDSQQEWHEARNNKSFVYPPGLEQLTHTLTFASTADSLEPNNTELDPATISDQQLTLTLHDPFDEDFIKYTAPPNASSDLTITVTHDFPLEDQGLRELISVEVTKISSYFLPISVISNGWQATDSDASDGDEYMIRVRQPRKRLPVQYRLQVGVGSDVYEQNGGNNTEATATPWPNNMVCDFSGLSIGNAADVDYFSFNSLGSSVEAELIYDPTYGPLELSVDGNSTTEIIRPGVKRSGVNLEQHATLAIYDTDRDVTWLRDTTASGKLNYPDAEAYVLSFNLSNFLGGNNWRLPTLDVTSGCLEGSNCADGELGHLYYFELRNQSGLPPGGGLANRGPFANLDQDYYWHSTKDFVTNEPFVFNFINGFQSTVNPGSTAYAWLLHDGDLVPVSGSRQRHERILACGSDNSIIIVSGGPANYGLCIRKIPAQAACPEYVSWTPFSGSGSFIYSIDNLFAPGSSTVTGDIQRGMFARILAEEASDVTWQIAAWSDYGNDIGQPVQGELVVPQTGTGSDGEFTGLVIAQSGTRTWYQKEGSCSAGRTALVNCNADSQCDTSSGSGDGVCMPDDTSTGNYAGAGNLIDSYDVNSGTDAMFWNVSIPNDRGTLTMQGGRDTDGDCIPDLVEVATGTDPANDDSDDDGLLDGEEDTNCDGIVDNTPGGGGSRQEPNDVRKAETDPRLLDSDGDRLSDGLERGLIKPHGLINTQPTDFRADADPLTTTDPVNPDTDGDRRLDGEEDRNGNGRLDEGETSPLVADVTKGTGIAGIFNWATIIVVMLAILGLFLLIRVARWLLNH